MQTIKVISNISYNTDAFFKNKINDLENRGIIDWCYWIRHKADTDETKSHIHLVLKPSRRLDTQKLILEFAEIDPSNAKPLGVTKKWNTTTSISDWLLYAVHDMGYLASKGQIRNYHYDFSAIQSTDEDALRADWNAIDRTKYNRLKFLADAVEKEVPFVCLVQDGLIPIAQRSQYEYQYKELLILKKTKQCARKIGHEHLIVDDDGVIIETAVKPAPIGGFTPLNVKEEREIDFEK